MISLYQCFNAKVKGDRIHCDVGHRLGASSTINIHRLRRGDPLETSQCQNCPSFDYMGESIPKNERGWIECKGK